MVRPRFVVNGVVDEADRDFLLELLTTGVEATIAQLPTQKRRRDDDLEDAVRRSIRSSVRSVTGTRPLVDVEIVHVPDGGHVETGWNKDMEVYSE